MKFLRNGMAVFILCSLFALPALAASRQYIKFSAWLRGDNGKPLAGFQVLTFSIFDNADRSGDPLWKQTIPVQVSRDGKYTVELGAGFPRFAQRVTDGHTLLYVSVRTAHSSAVSAATVLATIPQGIWVDCNPQ